MITTRALTAAIFLSFSPSTSVSMAVVICSSFIDQLLSSSSFSSSSYYNV